MISPSLLMISPRCIENPHCTAHPTVYCTDIMQGQAKTCVSFVGNWTNIISCLLSLHVYSYCHFISPLITLWLSFLANFEWSAPRIGQLLRECKYTPTDFNTSVKFKLLKIRQVINSSLLLVLNSPLLICEFMSSVETRLHQTSTYTVRANHVLFCLHFLDICFIYIISNLIELLLLMCADVHPHPGPRIK